jgi:hypothetical protein
MLALLSGFATGLPLASHIEMQSLNCIRDSAHVK